MANKRFLGLGFTFAATDRGLLKQLKSVQGALAGISNSLEQINGVGKTTSGTLGKIKMKGTGGVRAARVPQAKPVGKLADRKKATLTELTKGSLGKQDTEFFKEIKKSLSDNAFKTFTQDFNAVNKEFDESGNLTKRFKQELAKYAVTAFEATDGTARLQKSFKGFFKAFSNYAKDVGAKTKAFIETLGVDLSSIIPPQLTALGGLIGTLVSPLANLGKNLSKSLFPSKAEKLQKKLLSQIGGSGRGKGTLYDKLSELVGLSKQKGGKTGAGIFDKAKGLLGKVTTGLLGLSALKNLSPKSIVSGLAGLPKMFMNAAKAFIGVFTEGRILKGALDLFKNIFKIFGGLARLGGQFVMFEVFWSALKGIFQGVKESLPMWGEFWASIKKLGSTVWEVLTLLPSAAGVLFDKIKSGINEMRKSSPVIDAVFTGAGKLFGLIGQFFDMITDGWKKITQFIPVFGKSITDELTVGAKGMADSLKEFIAPSDKKFGVAAAEDPHGEKQVDLMAQLLDETRRTNELNSKMLDAMDKKNGPVSPMTGGVGRAFRSDPQNQFLSEGAF